MTKEQEAQQAQRIAGIKQAYQEVLGIAHRIKRVQLTQEQLAIGELIEFIDSKAQKIAEQEKEIDNLSKRGVKKYSEKELRAEFSKRFSWRVDPDELYEEKESAWFECARFLGALEEKP